jgi:hypothetical protein
MEVTKTLEKAMVEEVMAVIEQFYFSEGPESGQALFRRFVSKYHHIFEENCTILTEQKLEYTQIFNEF